MKNMATYWLDWNDVISTEYTCHSVEELLKWADDEFQDVLDGVILTEDNCSIQEVL